MTGKYRLLFGYQVGYTYLPTAVKPYLYIKEKDDNTYKLLGQFKNEECAIEFFDKLELLFMKGLGVAIYEEH